MAVKIRLTRKGKKKQPTYRVVVADSRFPRDGRYIEQIGRYDPRPDPSVVEIDNERAAYWLSQGAQPSDAVRKLLEISGAVAARRVREGRVHVVGEETQQQAPAEAAVDTLEESATDEPMPAGPTSEEAAADAGEDAATEETVVAEDAAAGGEVVVAEEAASDAAEETESEGEKP